jgi:drug/metabolite transporter (DMT)-like permease
LAALNTYAWGLCIREVGEPYSKVDFIFRLIFNRWFILAMASAFAISLLSYIVFRRVGIIVGRFLLTIQLVITIIVAHQVFNESISTRDLLGIILIIMGIILLGVR